LRGWGIAAAIWLAAVPAGADVCAIEGSVGGIAVRARVERGLRIVRIEAPTRVAVTPLRTGLAAIRTLEGDALEGETRAELSFTAGRAIRLGGVTIAAGAPLSRVAPAVEGPWALVDVPLGDGLHLRRARVPCDALEVVVAAAEPAAAARRGAPGPTWRPRTSRLHVFRVADGDESLRIDVAPESAARLAETARERGWVRVAWATPRARIDAWVRDSDLAR
jgi:hypothetical protein